MATLSVLTWIGNAAAVLFGRHGAVTDQAQQAGCSRQSAYHHAQRVHDAVADCQDGGPSRAELRDQVQRLEDENQQLRRCLEQTIDFPEERQRRFTATAAAQGLSVTQILALLALVLPAPRCPSRATLGRWLQQAGQRASGVLGVLDRACRTLVVALCIDEIFCRRQPLLIGVEPHSLTWVLGQRAADRTGATWCQALQPWDQARDVAADDGSGLQLGLKLAEVQRQQAGPVLPRAVRLDNFHIQQAGQRALRREWQEAEQRWVAAEAADHRTARSRRRGEDQRRVVYTAQAAWDKATAALHTVEQREQAWQRARAALEVFRDDGQLNDRAWAATQLRAAAEALPGPHWAKTRRMLLDERTLTFLDRLHEDLESAEPRAEVRAALARWWWLRRQRPECPQSPMAVLVEPLQGRLCQQLSDDWQQAYARVSRVLRRVLRSSSVVECMNSVVRMHQARHRKLTQGLLYVKRLHWNCREFASGKRRGHCPYAHLGVRLPTYDWWELLNKNPQELEQELSTLQLAA
jgi:hypothetical protein